MYHRSKFELDPASIKYFSRPRKVQAQYSAYIVKIQFKLQGPHMIAASALIWGPDVFLQQFINWPYLLIVYFKF